MQGKGGGLSRHPSPSTQHFADLNQCPRAQCGQPPVVLAAPTVHQHLCTSHPALFKDSGKTFVCKALHALLQHGKSMYFSFCYAAGAGMPAFLEI